MSQGTRSKVASHSKSGLDSSNEEDHEDVKASTSHITQSKLASFSSPVTLGESFIIKHNFGPLYPIPQSTQSPQIAAHQTGLQQFSNRIFHNAHRISPMV